MTTLSLFLLLAIMAQSHAQTFLDGVRCDKSTVEPVRTYSDGYAIAKAEGRPLLVFVSGKNCGPCKVLKREVLEPMRLNRQLDDCVLVEVDGESPDGLAVTKLRIAPQILAFANGVRYSIPLPVTREKLLTLFEVIRAQKKATAK